MSSLNQVNLIGRLGQDPDVRKTQSQTSVATISLATSSYRKDERGEKHEDTEWHRVILWGNIADAVGTYMRKGSLIFVSGRLATRSWEKDGLKHYTTEVIAENVKFLESQQQRPNAQSDGLNQYQNAKFPQAQQTSPQNAHRASQQQSSLDSYAGVTNLDVIPF